MIPEAILNRKGAQKPADIPTDVLKLLNEGAIASVNLSEWLAVDHAALARQVLGNHIELDALEKALTAVKKPSARNVTAAVGTTIAQHMPAEHMAF